MGDALLQKFGIETPGEGEPQVTAEQHQAALASLAEAGFSPADLEAVEPAAVVRIAQARKPVEQKPAAKPAEAAKPAPRSATEVEEDDPRDRALVRLIDFDLERRATQALGADAKPEQVTEVVERAKRLMRVENYQHPDEAVREAAEIHRARAASSVPKAPVRERSALAGLGSTGTRTATREAPPSMSEWQREWVNAKANGASATEIAAIEARKPEPQGEIKIYR